MQPHDHEVKFWQRTTRFFRNLELHRIAKAKPGGIRILSYWSIHLLTFKICIYYLRRFTLKMVIWLSSFESLPCKWRLWKDKPKHDNTFFDWLAFLFPFYILARSDVIAWFPSSCTAPVIEEYPRTYVDWDGYQTRSASIWPINWGVLFPFGSVCVISGSDRIGGNYRIGVCFSYFFLLFFFFFSLFFSYFFSFYFIFTYFW